MARLAALHIDTLTPPADHDGKIEVKVHTSLVEAEADWRMLEAEGVLTPYQRFDWVAGLVTAGAEPSGRMAIAVIRRAGRPQALLPLLIEQSYGANCARLLGADQSNSDWIMSRTHADLGPTDLIAVFEQIAQACGGIDLMVLRNQPEHWQGKPNPMLALPSTPAPTNLYATRIGGTPVPYVEHRLPTKRRSNINRGRRRLEELLGPVRLVRVADPAMLQQVHAVFIAQRGARFDEMGVANIFAHAPFPQFFRALAQASFGSRRPALCAHALFAGDEIVATSWGAMAGNHYSQYINSTSTGPAGRYSLTGILIAELMDELVQAGIDTFDLGLGDFDYKGEWTEPQAVFDSMIPLTWRGQVVAQVMQHRSALKRHIKQTPTLWRAAKWLRRSVFKLRHR